MYSDSDYSFYVSSVETGDELAHFAGHDYHNSGGRNTWGVESVDFDGNAVVARHYDGTVERLELPSRIAIVDGDWIDVTDALGNVERRRRRAVTGMSKYGQPYAITQLR
jgi:hypothetical protein